MGLAVALRFSMLSRKAFFLEGFSMLVEILAGAEGGAGLAAGLGARFSGTECLLRLTGTDFGGLLTGFFATAFGVGRALALGLAFSFGLAVFAAGLAGFFVFLAMGIYGEAWSLGNKRLNATWAKVAAGRALDHGNPAPAAWATNVAEICARAHGHG